MAAQPGRKESKTSSKKTAHFLKSTIDSARAGETYKWKLSDDGSRLLTEVTGRGAPYFNKAVGVPGQDTLLLSRNNLEKARQKGRSLVYVLPYRIVGTEEEVRQLITAAAAVYPDARLAAASILVPQSVISESNAANFAQIFADEEAAQKARRGDTEAANVAVMASLDRVHQQALARKAARGTGVKKTKKVGDKTSGSRLRDAFTGDNRLLNVSHKTSSGGRGYRTLKAAPSEGSKYKNVANSRFSRIYAANLEDYRIALEDLGATPDELALLSNQFSSAAASKQVSTVAPSMPQVPQGVVSPSSALGMSVAPSVVNQSQLGRVSPSRVQTLQPLQTQRSVSPRSLGAPAAPLTSGNSGTTIIRPLTSPRASPTASSPPIFNM